MHPRIACITWPRKAKGSVARAELNADEAAAAIRRLSSLNPDLICLPEGFLYAGIAPDTHAELALDSLSPILTQFSSLASDRKTHLVVPFLERRAGEVHNAVAVFDRAGRLLSTYRKRILWPSNAQLTNFEWSAVPGDGGPPVETDFGTFGIRVCLEMHSPAAWRLLKSQQVKLVVFPSEQSGGLLLRHLAWQTRAFIVSAVSKGGPSQVIDPVGNIVAEWTPSSSSPVIDLSLVFEFVHFDHNQQKINQLAHDYKGKVEIVRHEHERIWRIDSCDPGIDVGRILLEREILPLDEYLKRVNAANDLARCFSASTQLSTDRVAPYAPRTRTVSVIIPCLGIPESLSACLRALQSQRTNCKLEIVLVINGTDADTIAFEWPGITIVRETKKGPAAARNSGVRTATGDILAFIDSDCVASPAWVEAAARAIAKTRARCIVAGAITRPAEQRNWIALFDGAKFLQQESYVRRSQSFVTANLVVPRAVFEAVGFFDEDFPEAACEDWEWAARARRRGIAVVYEPEAFVEHPCMVKMSELRSKIERLARGELILKRKMRSRRIMSANLFESLRRELTRDVGHPALGTADKVRIMCVEVAVAYWRWRASRRRHSERYAINERKTR